MTVIWTLIICTLLGGYLYDLSVALGTGSDFPVDLFTHAKLLLSRNTEVFEKWLFIFFLSMP